MTVAIDASIEVIDKLVVAGILQECSEGICDHWHVIQPHAWHWTVLKPDQLPDWLQNNYKTYGEIRWY